MPRNSKPSCDGSWAALLREHLQERGKRPTGQGWKTMKEICAENNLSNYAAIKFVKRMISIGKIETFRGCEAKDKSSAAYLQIWYRVKP